MRTYNNHIAGALNLLMFEMTLTCEEHGNTLLIGKFDGILITDASARLNDSLDAIFSSQSHAIIEREETI